MRFFKANEGQSASEEEYKKPVEIHPYVENGLIKSFLSVIADAGDEEDIIFFQKESAKRFYTFFKNIVGELNEEVPVELVVNLLNLVFRQENMGSVAVKIDTNNKKVDIYLKESFVVKSLDSLYQKKMCVFYEVFFSMLFSDLLAVDIKFKEKQCSLEKGRGGDDVCVFESL